MERLVSLAVGTAAAAAPISHLGSPKLTHEGYSRWTATLMGEAATPCRTSVGVGRSLSAGHRAVPWETAKPEQKELEQELEQSVAGFHSTLGT